MDLLSAIKQLMPDYNPEIDLNKSDLRRKTFSDIRDLLINSNLSTWSERSFFDFVSGGAFFTNAQFATQNELFVNVLQDKYSLLYNHRNRCAHNTLSYQENLPTLKTLFTINLRDDNYFVRFGLLILIDYIFIELFRKYEEILE